MPITKTGTREAVKSLFLRNPGREFTVTEIVNRFRIGRDFAATCIKEAQETLNIVSYKEGSTVYYKLPKEETSNG